MNQYVICYLLSCSNKIQLATLSTGNILEPLYTKRLRIEALRLEHAQMVLEPLQNPSIYTYIPQDPPSAKDLHSRYEFLQNARSPDGEEHWLNWIAFLQDSMTPIGTFQATIPKGSKGSFAYIIFPSFWRQGYAREMSTCIIDHIFDSFDSNSLFAEIDTRNIGSIALAQSLGLSLVETKQGADFFKGESSDEFTYAVDRKTWQSANRLKN